MLFFVMSKPAKLTMVMKILACAARHSPASMVLALLKTLRIPAGFKVHSQLLKFDHESSHAKGCFYYTVLYAAGVANKLGPESFGAVSCIFGLPIALNSKAENMSKLALRSGAAGSGSAVFLVCVLMIGYLGWKHLRRKKKQFKDQMNFETELDDQILRPRWRSKRASLWFKIKEIERATDWFSPNNCIGRGQSGIVYKGMLEDGTVVAVKKIIESDFLGDAEFLNEVEIIGNLKHRNLVPLRGCCVSERNQNHFGETQRYLVYDYMPNGNLNEHLFLTQGQTGIGRKPLTWLQRKNIILDIANGIAYLHYGVKPGVYHRDIKTTNILLNADLRARIADFGLARQSREGDSHLTTRIVGTHGYLAPEYALYGQLTEKSDVYSFGMVVLEILTGKKALDLSSSSSRPLLVTDWVWSLVKEGKTQEAFDPSMLRTAECGRSRNQKGTMERFLMVGVLCAHLMVALRPTILDALKMLEGDIELPAILDRPIYAYHSTLYPMD
ncbi:OLC1v1002414C1 [Oldenlandia corymbosa var. corymbosa]|uniref:non-specific serine/threonine protein kinase n=1 Tax=Oldenlandia corymbosa var. corymbosa TaxID=529605 RepID=A0AAV1DB05_OLDCO|nr:OLC1v1002414C1 [Oldenlandia corymbosa var. corymbosa]